MFRGEFHRADGLVIPNNVTNYGVRTLLAAAVRNEVPTFFVGLVDAAPDPELSMDDVIEPSIGINGYQRLAVERSNVGWPTEGVLNGEVFFETNWLVWTAVGGNFNKPIRRLALVDADSGVIALSGPLPADLTITPTTSENNRRFKYRLYAR